MSVCHKSDYFRIQDILSFLLFPERDDDDGDDEIFFKPKVRDETVF